jgi:hypothetical protein
VLAEGMDHMFQVFTWIINLSCFAVALIVTFFLETWKPGNLETWKPGNLETWKPGNLRVNRRLFCKTANIETLLSYCSFCRNL